MNRLKIVRYAVQTAVIWCLFGLFAAHAHKGSDAFLEVRTSRTEPSGQTPAGSAGQQWLFGLSVAIKDLELVVPIDTNGDSKITWKEARLALPELLAYLNQSVALKKPVEPVNAADQAACTLDWKFDGLQRRSDGSYTAFKALAICDHRQPLVLTYSLLKDLDANHRLMVSGTVNGRDLLTTVSPQRDTHLVLAGQNLPGRNDGTEKTMGQSAPVPARGLLAVGFEYFRLGAQHLLEGYDHLAFLLALVLPLQLHMGIGSTPGRAQRVGRSAADKSTPAAVANRKAWVALIGTITAFTVGHSVTLILSTLGWTSGSPSWVEPVIAASIGATAILNLYPVKALRMEWLAVAFGLVHGYGFAGLLQESAAPEGLLPFALLGFNLGIEAGQLVAVSVWIAISHVLIANVEHYESIVRRGSWALALLSAWWFMQRVM